MKMKYEKPMVAVDLYQLTQAIAGCTITVGLINSGCFLESPNVPPEMKAFAANGWFVEGNCLIHTVAGTTYDGVYDGMCFHTQANGALTS